MPFEPEPSGNPAVQTGAIIYRLIETCRLDAGSVEIKPRNHLRIILSMRTPKSRIRSTFQPKLEQQVVDATSSSHAQPHRMRRGRRVYETDHA
jgi:hypothetical protein